MRGTIESIEAKKTKKQKPYHLVKIDGEAYWAWESAIVKGFSSGMVVDFESEGDEYPKLTSLTASQGETPGPQKKGGYNNNPKSMYISYAKDLVVARINSTTEGKEMTLEEIARAVIRMGLDFYQASENGVPKEDSIPEGKPPETEEPSFDSFNYQLINTKWKSTEELVQWWDERQKAMLKLTEDERKDLIKTYSAELGKTQKQG